MNPIDMSTKQEILQMVRDALVKSRAIYSCDADSTEHIPSQHVMNQNTAIHFIDYDTFLSELNSAIEMEGEEKPKRRSIGEQREWWDLFGKVKHFFEKEEVSIPDATMGRLTSLIFHDLSSLPPPPQEGEKE